MRCVSGSIMGVDGFRLDAVGTIFEDPDLTPHTVPMTLAELRRFSETAVTSAETRRWRSNTGARCSKTSGAALDCTI